MKYLIAILIFISFGVEAQTIKPHAKKMYRKGNRLIKNGNINRAILFYKQSLYESPQNVDAYLKVAEILVRKNEIGEALGFLSGAINLDVNYSFAYAQNIIKILKAKKDITSAISITQLLLSKPNLNPSFREQSQLSLESLRLMKNIEGMKIEDELVNLGDSINTSLVEYFPTLTLDESKMVFTRMINGANEDFFEAIQDSNKIWHKAINAGYPPNTSMPDGAACLSPDGRYLFYTRCDSKSPDGIEGGGCDIFYSYYTDSGWSAQQKFGYTINTAFYEGLPSISSTNYDLYFASNRPGGYGGMDLYVSHFVAGLWSEPINLGSGINTAKDETSPFIHPNNSTLYFVSNGYAGFGANDIFVSQRSDDTIWSKPLNIGPPINTKDNENQIYVNAYGNRAYVSVEKKEGKGKSDIYYTALPIFARAQPVKCIKGKVIDKKSKYPLKDLKFKFYKNGELYKNYLSNEGDASFELIVPADGEYRVEVFLENYKPFYRNMDFTDAYNTHVNYDKDIQLKMPEIVDTLLDYTYETNFTDSLKRFFMKQSKKWTDDSAKVKLYFQYEYPYGFDSLYAESRKLYQNDGDSICFYEQQVLNEYIEQQKEDTKAIVLQKYHDLFNFFDLETKPIEIVKHEIYANEKRKYNSSPTIKVTVIEEY